MINHSMLLNLPKVKTIVDDPESKSSSSRLVLLNHDIQAKSNDAICTFSESLNLTDAIALSELPEPVKSFANEIKAQFYPYSLKLGYDHWTSDQILRSVLPDGIDVPGAFETIGHIGMSFCILSTYGRLIQKAHLNLRDEHEPYKNLIGQVIIDVRISQLSSYL